MQKWILENPNTFNLKDILECGQCFRWNEIEQNRYIGIVGQNVVSVEQKGNNYIFTSEGKDDLQQLITKYFDLERDYEKIKETLSKIDNSMKESIEYGKGIRILNQDLWETIISFIISANNNIPRIRGIIERIAKAYGKKIVFEGKEYYSFPTSEELAKAEVEDLRKLGLGFRDIRVKETTQMVNEKKVDLESLQKEIEYQKVRETLLTLSGVGPKVADCILLFSTLKRWEAFPIDVWVRRVMNEIYIKKEDETKVSRNEIEKLAQEKFGNLAGMAQQYLFYWKREA